MTVRKIFIGFCNNIIRHFSNEINKRRGGISFCGGWNFSKFTPSLLERWEQCHEPQKQHLWQTTLSKVLTKLVEMSSSWNFPARASSSHEGSEPSWSELSWGTSIFELKPSWQKKQFFDLDYKCHPNFLILCIYYYDYNQFLSISYKSM